MDNIKIIRLQNGEDVIGAIQEDEISIIISYPLSLIFKTLPDGKHLMMMTPWIPLEIVEDGHAHIHNEDVLTVFTPKRALIVYYHKYISDIQQRADEEYDEIENALLSEVDEEDNYMEEDDSGELEEEHQPIIDSTIRIKRVIH
jgi:hypothetical protein